MSDMPCVLPEQTQLAYAPSTRSSAGAIEQREAERWRREVLRVLSLIATYRFEFTADDWHARCETRGLSAPHHPNQWGIATREAYRRGIIKKTGRYVKSKRPEANGREIPVWRAG